MDIDIMRSKEDSMARCIARIETKKDLPYEALLEDYDAQDVIALNLERAVQQACDIAAMILADTNEPVVETMRAAFATLQRIQVLSQTTAEHMMKAVGFRNIAVHVYQDIDWAIVYSIIHERLNDFRNFIREVDQFLKRTNTLDPDSQ